MDPSAAAPENDAHPIDAALLELLLRGLPLVERPYAVIAQELGTDEAIVTARIGALRESAKIQRICGAFDADALDSPEAALTDRDKDAVRALQFDLPPSPRPFLELAEPFGFDEGALLERARHFLQSGCMLRYGAHDAGTVVSRFEFAAHA